MKTNKAITLALLVLTVLSLFLCGCSTDNQMDGTYRCIKVRFYEDGEFEDARDHYESKNVELRIKGDVATITDPEMIDNYECKIDKDHQSMTDTNGYVMHYTLNNNQLTLYTHASSFINAYIFEKTP